MSREVMSPHCGFRGGSTLQKSTWETKTTTRFFSTAAESLLRVFGFVAGYKTLADVQRDLFEYIKEVDFLFLGDVFFCSG